MTISVHVETFDTEAEVHRRHPESGEAHIPPETVGKGEKRVFYVHGRQDILVKEKPSD